MDLQHLVVKIPVEGALAVDPSECLELFHRWVADQALPELLVDVADLRHVPSGPGVVLVGLQADYALDHGAGVWGLLYRRKDTLPGDNADRVAQALGAAAGACLRLESAFAGRLRFSRVGFDLVVNDRLLAPNTDETRRLVVPELQTIVATLAGASGAEVLPQGGDPRRRFGVTVTVPVPLDLAALATPVDAGH